MKLRASIKLVLASFIAFVLSSVVLYGQTQVNFDQHSWNMLTISEQEKILENLRFEMLHERNESLQAAINELKSFQADRVSLNNNNMLKIPLRTGKLEVKALFKKARGEILVCTNQKIEAVLDTYRLVAVVDPADSTKVLASFAGDDPNLPTEPVSGSIKSDGKTARITAGADWIELSYAGNNTYNCRTNKVPIKITAKFID